MILPIIIVIAALMGSPKPPPHCPEWSSPACADDSPWNGFWGIDGWVPGIPSLETRFAPVPTKAVGNAVYYAPGVMEATAEIRGLSLDGYVDGVSLLTCREMGYPVWLKRPGYGWEGPFLVADCAAQGDLYTAVVHRGEVVEVGYETALRWGMIENHQSRIEGVEVLSMKGLWGWGNPYSEPIVLKDWLISIYETVPAQEPLPYYDPENCWRIKGVWYEY